MREGNVMPDEGFTELAGPRVMLRRFHPDDVATFVAYRSSDPNPRISQLHVRVDADRCRSDLG